ncbi:MAG: fumarate hydratase [Candidatus Omnitrophota bacterium]
MRIIKAQKIKNAVSRLCEHANIDLRKDVLSALKTALRFERGAKSKAALRAIIKNAEVARKERLAICQDTGLPSVLVELGQEVKVDGNLKAAIHKGIEEGYRKASLRNSIVSDPLKRGVPSYVPGLIHIDLVKGSRIKITVMPKGFGCENKTQLKMFNPTDGTEEVKKFIVDAVKAAGPDACPPYVVGVGIGGSADYACFLAKKALLNPLQSARGALSRDLLKRINNLKIGPMGLGGRTTALAVNVLTYPTHIAGLPVAINISCHATRSATLVL